MAAIITAAITGRSSLNACLLPCTGVLRIKRTATKTATHRYDSGRVNNSKIAMGVKTVRIEFEEIPVRITKEVARSNRVLHTALSIKAMVFHARYVGDVSRRVRKSIDPKIPACRLSPYIPNFDRMQDTAAVIPRARIATLTRMSVNSGWLEKDNTTVQISVHKRDEKPSTLSPPML
jgi:hypothetical protein